MSLVEIGKACGTDKFDHGYLPHYERYLPKGNTCLLEIGIHQGASLLMWKKWYGASGTIVGVDIKLNPELPDMAGIQIIEADATKKEFFDSLGPRMFDVVIDDGSHLASEIVSAYQGLWPYVRPGGWYVIEDLGAAFWPEWEGGPDGSAATAMINLLMFDVFRGWGIAEMHIHQEIAFVKKPK